ncbi:hypothetical protein ACIRRA_21825 [Nocardia sp. NPDC101769]|uniref:hypothetical protein n=1 Tax=Nocardia sp. NPDC101769 TaxID=3364333 RepID=UPI0037F86672
MRCERQTGTGGGRGDPSDWTGRTAWPHSSSGRRGGAPALGGPSNCFRTRSALIEGAVRRLVDIELLEFASGEDASVQRTLARFGFRLEGVRSPDVARTLRDQRERFIDLAESTAASRDLPLTSGQFVGLMLGLQFAELSTGEKLLDDVLTWLYPNSIPELPLTDPPSPLNTPSANNAPTPASPRRRPTPRISRSGSSRHWHRRLCSRPPRVGG